jgi:hypothetical protein
MVQHLCAHDVSSLNTFEQVKFWIWVKEGIVPYQQHLVWGTHEVDDTYKIVESWDLSLVVEEKVSAMYKVLISSGWRTTYRPGEVYRFYQEVLSST